MNSSIIKPRRSHSLAFPIKMVWVAILMILAFKFGFGVFNQHFGILVDTQESRCIPEYSVYFLLKNNKEVQKGKIYAFKAQGLGHFFKDNTILGKYASAISGDTVVLNEQGAYVNGTQVTSGYALSDKLDVSVEQLYRTITVGNGKIFFTGTADRSYDSRYWGLADVNQVVGEAIPLW